MVVLTGRTSPIHLLWQLAGGRRLYLTKITDAFLSSSYFCFVGFCRLLLLFLDAINRQENMTL